MGQCPFLGQWNLHKPLTSYSLYSHLLPVTDIFSWNGPGKTQMLLGPASLDRG